MTITMSGRERLKAALRGQQVDRLPWSLCMDKYYTNSLPDQGFNMDLIETLRFFKNDIMERHVPTYRVRYDREISFENKTMGKDTITTYKTPVGDIFEVHSLSQTGRTTYVTKHLVENIEDVRVYQYLHEHMEYLPDYDPFMKQDAFIGDDGMATPSGPLTPIQNLLQGKAGVENTVYLLADYPDEMDELFATMHKKNLRAYEIIADSPAYVCFVYEDTSTTVMSRKQYAKYCSGYINEYADIIHACDKVFITHMCGKLKGFADLVGAGRMDGIDSLCPPTTGDFWAHDARSCWGQGKVIIGGLEPPALAFMNAEQTVRYAVNVINLMAPGKAFILSSGDAVASGTPIQNLSAITQLVQKYCSYPLDGKIDANTAVKEIWNK